MSGGFRPIVMHKRDTDESQELLENKTQSHLSSCIFKQDNTMQGICPLVGWFIQKTASNVEFPTSLPQACIISIKVCRQRPSCCKQSCPRRVVTVSIDGRSVLDVLEAINVFFIWELQIQK
jgi:hypothetical protein